MSRMAAKFNNNPSSSTSASSASAATKPKKFCTRGEEFFDFLKSLGYQPTSKHQKYEHFEYLFQDDTSISFARKLMSTLKTQHCLLPEEIERFESLKNQGFVLYGNDLEEGVARRQAINEMYSQQKHKKQAKKEELEKDLEIKRKEKETLKELETTFQKEINDWQIKEEKVTRVLGAVQRLFEESEKDIEIDLRLLNEKMSELETTVVQLKKELSVEHPDKANTHYLCQIDGRRLVEKEEKLFDITQEMIRKHGKNLIIKEAGYGIEGDPLNTGNIRKLFFQFEKDFDRLKHCIIYERVNQITLELSLAGQQGGSEKFDEYCRRAAQLSAFDYETRAKLQVENRDSINNLTITFQRESEELLDRVRECALEAINHQFSALTNIKARSKKKLQEFFTLITNVLKGQKVRITLIRNLVKAEGKLYGRLLRNIEENLAASSAHSKALSSTKKQISALTLEGQILSAIFAHFEIPEPFAILTSTSTAHTIARKIFYAIESSSWNEMEGENQYVQNELKNLNKTQIALQDVLESVTDPTKQNVKTRIAEAEKHVKGLEEKLNALLQTRAPLIKEQLKLRQENLEKMKELLES